jgi:hypothetical protein
MTTKKTAKAKVSATSSRDSVSILDVPPKAPVSTQARVASYNARFADSGGRTISTLRLKPDASAALAALQKQKEASPTAIISALLLAAAQRIKRK